MSTRKKSMATIALLITLCLPFAGCGSSGGGSHWVTLRQYTKVATVPLILTPVSGPPAPTFYVLGPPPYSSAGGECPSQVAGPYVTDDLFLTPDTFTNSSIIATIIGIPNPPPGENPTSVTAYVDIEVNTEEDPDYRSEFSICNIRGADQLHHNGPIYFSGIGGPGPYVLKDWYPPTATTIQ